MDNKVIASELVDIVNDCTNDYDARDMIEDYLDDKAKLKDKIMGPLNIPSGKNILIAVIIIAAVLIGIGIGLGKLF